MDKEKIRNEWGYKGKPLQWRAGFDAALSEIEKPLEANKEPLSEVPCSDGVMRRCQRMAGIMHHSACRSKKDIKAYKIMADREAYTCINVRVYLCPKCAEEMGV